MISGKEIGLLCMLDESRRRPFMLELLFFFIGCVPIEGSNSPEQPSLLVDICELANMGILG